MQQKVLDVLEDAVERSNAAQPAGVGAPEQLEWVVQMTVANGGRAYLQRGLETLASVQFDFQGSYCWLAFRGPAVVADLEPGLQLSGGRVEHPTDAEGRRLVYHHIDYADGALLEQMLGMWRDAIEAAQGLR